MVAVGRDPIPPENTGIVTAVRQHGTWAQVDIRWDKGRTLMLVDILAIDRTRMAAQRSVMAWVRTPLFRCGVRCRWR